MCGAIKDAPQSALNLGQMGFSGSVAQLPCPTRGMTLRLCEYCPVTQKSPERGVLLPTVVTCPLMSCLLPVFPSPSCFRTSAPWDHLQLSCLHCILLSGSASGGPYTGQSWHTSLATTLRSFAPCFPLLDPVFLNIRLITRPI